MDFFLDMLLTVAVSLFFSFIVSKLVSVAMAGNSSVPGNDSTSDQAEKPEIGVSDNFSPEELRFGLKMNARVLQSARNFRVVDENVKPVDRFGSEADRVDELVEAATGNGKIQAKRENLVVRTAEAESTAAVSLENVIAKEIIVRGQDERSDSVEEFMVRTTEAVSTALVSPENVVEEEVMIRGQEERSESTEGRSACLENEESGNVVIAESKEARVVESNTVEESENKMEWKTEEEKEELSIEEDDDWEGIERSDLEKTFAAAANFLEESRKAEEIGAEAKMELYGLHKIATEGSCREAQPMAVMVSARAKWNAWQKLGNMNQEEAMEQYLALISKEIPDWMNSGHNVGKMPEMVTSVVLHSNSGSLEDSTTLATTCVASSKNGER